MKRLLALGSACIMLYANNITPQADGIEPRTLHDYVNQETDFIEFLKERHPMFKYEKEGNLVGKYSISNRQEEFVEFGGHGNYEKDTGRSASITYRLGMESILDYPNKFVGPKKCGE